MLSSSCIHCPAAPVIVIRMHTLPRCLLLSQGSPLVRPRDLVEDHPHRAGHGGGPHRHARQAAHHVGDAGNFTHIDVAVAILLVCFVWGSGEGCQTERPTRAPAFDRLETHPAQPAIQPTTLTLSNIRNAMSMGFCRMSGSATRPCSEWRRSGGNNDDGRKC